MTHLPDITPELALAVLLNGVKLQQAPSSRTPRPLEAVVSIGKDNHAIVSIQQEDLDALIKVLEDQALQPSPGATRQIEAQTVHTELKDGHVVALESYRPKPDVGGSTQRELRDYALRELAPFIELAEEGKIRVMVVAAELTDDRLHITYPMGQWEPGLIAGAQLLQRRLIDQG